ncbi:alanine or glycine:cation symporter, AGCS family [Paenimyroides ummariense]|uniref:Alanine or glycine:cation symporter, AGCS family n=1 Tax=Paenimyroides ummariense TaxID=913024 RepID=A0A1I5FPP6_9FLAO|nr:alanine/glycine:cation symporter family protein [Paenimyroides ummariense]SFO25744.1 alanine or glycine:cation symporter, AGCS family [Paenimyroides ummariense]
MESVIYWINDIVWSQALVILCLGTGLFFSFRLKFPQIRLFKEMIRLLFGTKKSKEGISSFQAFTLAISGRIGTGNIAGVATAIAMGGPGAIFWMWTIAFLGSASAIIEATLAQTYKQVSKGEFRGGPAYYILKGLKSKHFAVLFALATVISCGFLLPSVQSNSIALAVEKAFNVDTVYTAVAVCLLLATIIIGGVKRISSVAEVVVPFMAVSYIVMALVIIALNISRVPDMFSLIFNSAFGVDATFGGIVGSAISWGVQRGIYSNEAGQGTAPHAAAAAEVSHPYKQGLVQGFSVYVDTLFVCTATALMILFTNQYNVMDSSTGYIVENLPGIEAGAAFTQSAVSVHFPAFGNEFVAVALMFFAFTTVMAYYYIAESNIDFLFKGTKSKYAIWILRILILFSVYVGCVNSAKVAWTLGDIGVGLMAWMNLIAILLLYKKAIAVVDDYEKQKKLGEDPQFDNAVLNLENVEYWESSLEDDNKI